MEGAEITDCHAARQGCLGAMAMIVAMVATDVVQACHHDGRLRMSAL